MAQTQSSVFNNENSILTRVLSENALYSEVRSSSRLSGGSSERTLVTSWSWLCSMWIPVLSVSVNDNVSIMDLVAIQQMNDYSYE